MAESEDIASAPLAQPKFNAFGFVEGYVCPVCGSQVQQSHVDDIGTTFFKCQNGHTSARLKNIEKERFLEPLRETVRLQKDPEILKKFMLHLSRTVKRDYVTKNMVFLTGLSAYTKNPINLFLRGQSSIGKTYNATQTLRYFPEEDVWFLGGLSPKALIHSYGLTLDSKGEEIDFSQKPSKEDSEDEKKAWNERLKTARTLVDLHGKILVFLEAPHFETYNMLRPILSHDKQEISYKFTDKTAKGQLRTTHVVIRGFPATVFCTTDEKYIQDLATRGFTVTPETDEPKIREANLLTGERKALPWKFREDHNFTLFCDYIAELRTRLEDLNVAIPYARELAEHFPTQYTRSMRDFSHLTALIEVLAFFHCMQRPVLTRKIQTEKEDGAEENYILAALKDLEYVFDLWRNVEETTVTGLPQHILDFYHRAVEPLSQTQSTFSIEDLAREYNKEATDRKSSDTLGRWVKHLCDVGWLSKDPDPNDKRKVAVSVIKKAENNRNYPQIPNAEILSLENFKAWLNEAEQISASNTIKLRENLLADEPTTPEQIFNEHFLVEKSPLADISLSQNQPSTKERASELSVNQKCGNLRIISLGELLPRLRAEFSKGTEEDFIQLCVKHGYTRENAESLLKRLTDETGELATDKDGFWTWVRR